MTRKISHTSFLLLLLAAVLAACAPGQGISATLTMLPGTPTPRRPTRTPTPSLEASSANTPVPTIETAVPPDRCPPFSIDTAAPEDPSQLPGHHFDISHLPDEYKLVASGVLPDSRYSWVQVFWQDRSVYWIEKITCRDTSGIPYWEIVDALALPRLNAKAGEAETTLCFLGVQQVPMALAYGVYDNTQPPGPVVGPFRGWELRVQGAWRMADRFIPLDTEGIKCMVQEPQGGS